MKYRVRNLDRFQHYKSGNGARPKWIKWYVSGCLDDPKFMAMSDGAKWIAQVAVQVSLERDDNVAPKDRVEFRIRRKVKDNEEKELVDSGFFENSRVSLEEVYSNSREPLEQSRVEESRVEENRIDKTRIRDAGFVEWWSILTGRIGNNGARVKGSKKQALVEWKRHNLADQPLEDVIRGTRAYQDATDYPKDAERILSHELWRQALDDAPVKKKPFVNRMLTPEEIAEVKAGRLKL